VNSCLAVRHERQREQEKKKTKMGLQVEEKASAASGTAEYNTQIERTQTEKLRNEQKERHKASSVLASHDSLGAEDFLAALHADEARYE